ncbi:unnamed protein product [Somion occarium]|uniref:Uncharacterized protein n=1 Tax=Somion occarium TaxID=3059160 RepID=A0ABP1DT86_9APHY
MRFPTLFITLLALPNFLSLFVLGKPTRQPFSPANIPQRRTPTATTSTVGAAEPRSVMLKQHRERRAILDVCAYIDTDALVGAIIPGLVIPIHELAHLKLCLCLSALPVILETDLQLQLLAGLLGKDAINAALVALINHSPNSKHCNVPEHGSLQCTPKDPCGISCTPPYVPEGGQCVCKAPYTSCNGHCGYFPHGCGSAVPLPPYKRLTT